MTAVSFEDLEDSLKQLGFTLTKKYGRYKVTPTLYKTPVYEFDFLGEVLAFHTGVEAQKRLNELT